MFWTRLISGVALVIISFIVLFIGGPVTGIFAIHSGRILTRKLLRRL